VWPCPGQVGENVTGTRYKHRHARPLSLWVARERVIPAVATDRITARVATLRTIPPVAGGPADPAVAGGRADLGVASGRRVTAYPGRSRADDPQDG
jgi:hypothetical protein